MNKAEKQIAEKFAQIVFEIHEDHFPNRKKPQIEIKFSNHLSSYNANINYLPLWSKYTIKMNKNWLDSDEAIVRGLFEYLVFRVNKKKLTTIYTNMYENFIKNAHIAIEKDKIDPQLQELFERNNNELLGREIEQTNLVWGPRSKRTLGTYNYQNDTITISSILQNASNEIIRFVLYHEMLHKKHKFESRGKNTIHHSPAFKREEKLFPNFDQINKDLDNHLRGKRGLKRFFSW